ncbi:MAG TPA: class I SAM-dependent methyltransferase [Kofleriaceae bacterium]|nr:class I SAM-dependent methyltransferase [Kofleriaceae bacterium]
MTESNVDLAALKAHQRAAWSAGNYAVVGTTFQIVGEHLCEALDLHAGWRVLDVAAGNGNATLAAARRGAEVTSTDYVPALLEAGRRRAAAEGLTVRFQEADAEHLPFADGSFDVVMSTFGVMFAPDQPRAAAELARVCKPGGRIGLASWTPESFIGQLFEMIGAYVPWTAGATPPALWGTEARLAELFGAAAASIQAARRWYRFRYRHPMHFIDIFHDYFGPIKKTFEALDPDQQASFTRDLFELIELRNRSGDATLVMPSEYLEVVIEKRSSEYPPQQR